VNEQTQERQIRLLLLDNQALFRASLSHLLASQRGLQVVGECGSPEEALALLSASPVDVILLDPFHATEGGNGFMPAARRSGYQGRFLVVAEAADAGHSALAIRLGVSGIVLTSEAPERLVSAITLVANGAVWFDQKIIQLLAEHPPDRPPRIDDPSSRDFLPERERKVLLGILGGLTNGEISANLGLSEGAVKVSVQHLLLKVGVRTRSQLVRAVLEGSLGTAKELMRRTRSAAAASAPCPANPGKLPLATAGKPSEPRQTNP
jgi:DNA-binding NarL/FixJ family response regulator